MSARREPWKAPILTQGPRRAGAQLVGQSLADLLVVGDARFRHVDGGDSVQHVRFQLQQALAADQFALHAVGLAAGQQVIHRPQFALVGGDDDLADALERDALALAKLLHHLLAGAAVDGLEGVGLVVDAGVQHAGVAPRLVIGQRRLLLQQGDVFLGVALAKGVGRSQADDATADDENV